jgi:hypothetical protein
MIPSSKVDKKIMLEKRATAKAQGALREAQIVSGNGEEQRVSQAAGD